MLFSPEQTINPQRPPSISFDKFGKTRTQDFLNNESLRGQEAIVPAHEQNPPTIEVFRDKSHHVNVLRPIEFQDPEKGDDRIFSGFVRGCPTIIVADGVSVVSRGDEIIQGKSNDAAEAAMVGSLEMLSSDIEGIGNGDSEHILTSERDPLELYNIISKCFYNAAYHMRIGDLPGATTLLIAFLYEYSNEGRGIPTPMWYYGYSGDGNIGLVSPNRKVDGIPLQTRLLSPQKIEHTAGVSAQGSSVQPIIGSMQYTPGDILFAHSDGMDSITRWLRENRRMGNLGHLIYNSVENPQSQEPAQNIADLIKDYQYTDDAVLGVIATK